MEINEMRLEAQDLNQQASVLIQTGNLDSAKAKIEKAIDLDPMLMDSYKNYGDLYMTIQEFEEAKNMYKKALLIEKQGELYFLYGNACFMMDNPHEGLEYYNLALSAGYDNDEMLFFMGMAYEHMNDDNMALRYFQKACVKNPSRSDYIVKKISAQIRLNLLDSAEESVEELLLNSPELFDGYHIKTQLLLFKKEFDEAEKFSKAASERFPEDADLLYDYIKCISLKGEFDKSLDLIDKAKKMKYFEDSKRNFTMLEAQITAEKGDVNKAIECCNQCIQMEDEYFDGEARFMLMNLLLANKDFESTLSTAEGIIDNDAEDSYYFAALYFKPFCMKNLGKVNEANDVYREAIAIFRLATLKDPSAYDAYLYRAMCHKDLEEYDKALELLDFIKNLNDEIAEIYTMKAEVYTSMGKHSLAKEELEKAFKIKPELRPEEDKGE